MASEPPGVTSIAGARERAEMIRHAVELDFEPISRAVGAMVRSVERGRDREWLRQRTEEVTAEAICRALERPDSYDPGRPIVAWIVGIARNVIRGEARVASGRPRRADLDEAAWGAVLGVIDPGGHRAADHLDVEQMLSRLSPRNREAIELHYFRGLRRAELVEALGAPSAEAARTRVSRARQALRDLFAQDGPEVDR